MQEQKNSFKSLLMLLASLLIFGTLGTYRKFLTLTSASIAFYRSVIGVAFLILFMKIRRDDIKKIFALDLKTFLLLFLTGVILGVNWLFLFEGFNYAPVSLVSLSCYMHPMFVIAISAVLFNEKITLKKALCFAAALIGMFFISGVIEAGIPERENLAGIVYGLISGVLYGLVLILNKYVRGVDPYIKTIIQLAGAALSMIPYLLFTNGFAGDIWSVKAVILMAVIGVINTGAAYVLYFGSMDGLRAQTIALLGYLDPVITVTLAALILGERLTIWGITGAVLILGAAVICELGNDNK